ncbi:MAG: DNA-processing protein DprA, partial [Candidatus Omnitrophota bacterium]|nr:DNA-processing protein DprA [Candidatus Omnitrophota bacterium]
LITANFAAEQGRAVFAVPGKVSSATSSGTNELIRDGACLIQSVDDILQELSIAEIEPAEAGEKDKIDKSIASKSKAYIYNSLTEDERKVYKILSDEPLYIDEVLAETGISAQKVAKVLLNLELKALIKELPGKQFVKKQ